MLLFFSEALRIQLFMLDDFPLSLPSRRGISVESRSPSSAEPITSVVNRREAALKHVFLDQHTRIQGDMEVLVLSHNKRQWPSRAVWKGDVLLHWANHRNTEFLITFNLN